MTTNIIEKLKKIEGLNLTDTDLTIKVTNLLSNIPRDEPILWEAIEAELSLPVIKLIVGETNSINLSNTDKQSDYHAEPPLFSALRKARDLQSKYTHLYIKEYKISGKGISFSLLQPPSLDDFKPKREPLNRILQRNINEFNQRKPNSDDIDKLKYYQSIIELLGNNDADITATYKGKKPLIQAVLDANSHAVKVLCKLDKDAGKTLYRGHPLLSWLNWSSPPLQKLNWDIAKTLSVYGADINAMLPDYESGYPDWQEQSDSGIFSGTLLIKAAKYELPWLFHQLLLNGANPNQRNNKGLSAAQIVNSKKNSDCKKILEYFEHLNQQLHQLLQNPIEKMMHGQSYEQAFRGVMKDYQITNDGNCYLKNTLTFDKFSSYKQKVKLSFIEELLEPLIRCLTGKEEFFKVRKASYNLAEQLIEEGFKTYTSENAENSLCNRFFKPAKEHDENYVVDTQSLDSSKINDEFVYKYP